MCPLDCSSDQSLSCGGVDWTILPRSFTVSRRDVLLDVYLLSNGASERSMTDTKQSFRMRIRPQCSTGQMGIVNWVIESLTRWFIVTSRKTLVKRVSKQHSQVSTSFDPEICFEVRMTAESENTRELCLTVNKDIYQTSSDIWINARAFPKQKDKQTATRAVMLVPDL
jgi:hypothetical protein